MSLQLFACRCYAVALLGCTSKFFSLFLFFFWSFCRCLQLTVPACRAVLPSFSLFFFWLFQAFAAYGSGLQGCKFPLFFTLFFSCFSSGVCNLRCRPAGMHSWKCLPPCLRCLNPKPFLFVRGIPHTRSCSTARTPCATVDVFLFLFYFCSCSTARTPCATVDVS